MIRRLAAFSKMALVGIVVSALALAAFAVQTPQASAQEVQQAEQGCEAGPERPAATFSFSDETAAVEVSFDLNANNLNSVEITRDRLAAQADRMSAEATQATNDYLDELAAWFDRPVCDEPSSTDSDSSDAFVNVPDLPDTPFGFGATAVQAPPPVELHITIFEAPAVPNSPAMPESPVSASPVTPNQPFGPDEGGDIVRISNGSELAVSGSESVVLVYFGAGLVAFGATALGMRRWMGGPLD